jgi:hypothetical protein
LKRREFLCIGIAFVLALSVLCLAAPAAEVFPVELKLTPPGANNTVELTITGDLSVGSDWDTQTATITGNILANVGLTFDPSTGAATPVTLELTGGRAAFSDMSFELSFFLAGIEIESSGMSGTFDTPVPPGTVTAGQFNTNEHVVILDQGMFSALGTGLLAIALDPNPYVVDLAATPMEATTDATGTLTASGPTIAGGIATYTITMLLPVVIDEVAYEDPTYGSLMIQGQGTLEAKGTLSVPLFGKLALPASTGLEEAAAGATSFSRGTGDTEIAWTMAVNVSTVSSAYDVQAGFTDPSDAGNHHQFHLNNAAVDIRTERIDLRATTESVQASIDLRTWDTSTGFEDDDNLTVKILTSPDGYAFTEASWIALAGAQLTALNKGQNGAFTTYRSATSLIPAGTKTIIVAIHIDDDSANEHVFWDNLTVEEVSLRPFRRGDCNADGRVDLSDAVKGLNWAFAGGAEPPCQGACDSNDDGKNDVSDAVKTLSWLFTGGTAPPAPGPTTCGDDPSAATSLSCGSYPTCAR